MSISLALTPDLGLAGNDLFHCGARLFHSLIYYRERGDLMNKITV